jgi:uncharacterized protein (TIGR03083 family)
VAEPLIGSLASVWSTIADLCRGLDEASWDTPTECPGWSVKDNVAHLIGIESLLLGEPTPDVEVGDAPHVRNDFGRNNEVWVESFRAQKGDDVLAAFEAVAARRLEVLRAMSRAEWDAETFTPEGPAPYRRFMVIRVFDCWYHEQDIREALDVPGGLEGPVADIALGNLERGLSYVVGKKAGAPQDATVVFEVHGEPRLVVPIGVEGRAAVLDAVPGEPTVRLSMDRRTYNRLCGGRWSGERALDEGRVEIDGDRHLGETIVKNMGFTI